MSGAPETALPEQAFEAQLRDVGARRYHDRHPFNRRMHEGALSREELRCWVANRYYYQTRIPKKDGLIVEKSPDPAFRDDWAGRIRDHEGDARNPGGLELWLALADAVGLERDAVRRFDDVLPGVRRACDAYVEFVAGHDLLEAVAASLTELFAGDIMARRIAAFEKHYAWIDASGLQYFRSRTRQAPEDARKGLAFVLANAASADDQRRCLAALERKCSILWNLLDAIEAAHQRPSLHRDAMPRLDDPEPLVVLPERAVALGGSGREILAFCDGRRSALGIVAAMRERHPEAGDLADDVHDFLDAMVEVGVLERGTSR